MNIQDMHLAIRQGVDKINSLQADLLLSEEVDIELNKAQTRFINSRLIIRHGQGFETSQKRIDDLRTLMREYEDTVTFKEQLSNNKFVDSFKFPLDYLYLVNQRSKVVQNNCGKVNYILKNPASLDFNYFIVNFENFFLDYNTKIVSNIGMIADPTNPSLGAVDIIDPVVIAAYTYPQDIEAYRQAFRSSFLGSWILTILGKLCRYTKTRTFYY